MKKILVIEDEKILSDVISSSLEKRGYDVEVAKDGMIGLELIKKGGYDLVLLDIIMPKMNGFEVLEKVKEAGREIPAVPIIVVSNSGQEKEIERVKELGATDWLLKTEFEPQEVVDKAGATIGEPEE